MLKSAAAPLNSGDTLPTGLVIPSPSISNPTVTGVADFSGATYTKGVPFLLGRSGIPFIHISSGSIAANGAISGITALPLVYPHAYCYLPANAVATVAAAGWYYCTFSTTTAGTAFLNTYTSGNPTVPGSPTAVTDGKGAYTGDTSARIGPSITVPAGSMGANGSLLTHWVWEANNTANGKTARIFLGGSGGTDYFGIGSAVSLVRYVGWTKIANEGRTTSQRGSSVWTQNTTANSLTPVQGSIATASATTVDFSLAKGTATDHLILSEFDLLLLSDGT